MPNRIVREGILDSDAVNKLTWAAEVFYRRLMSVVDDFGRYDARPEMLRAKLYPMRLDKVSLPDIVKWLADCVEAGLVRCYEVLSKPYLEIINFGQQLRQKRSKYPEPESDCKQMISDDINCVPESNRIETESKRISITVGQEYFLGKTSEWLMKHKESAIETFLMANRKYSREELFKKLDEETNLYHFKDTNHPYNYFKSLYGRMGKKEFGRVETPAKEIKILT